VEIKNLPKGSAAIFLEKTYAVKAKLIFGDLLHYAVKSNFHFFPEIFILYFFILDILKMSIFQKLAYFFSGIFGN
jgi:hypothetical protein